MSRLKGIGYVVGKKHKKKADLPFIKTTGRNKGST